MEIIIIICYFDGFVNNRPNGRQSCPSLCLIGQSGLGQTDNVRRSSDYVYCDGEISCKRMNTNARSMVFDDVPSARFGNVGH